MIKLTIVSVVLIVLVVSQRYLATIFARIMEDLRQVGITLEKADR